MIKAKKQKRIFLLIVACLLLLLLINFVALYYPIFGSSVIQAQLHVESGVVLVNSKAVTGIIRLYQGDIIQTKNGFGTIILYEHIWTGLQNNTTIIIDDLTKAHPQIKQESGTSWTKFVKVLGINGFSVATSNTVASVRATAFEISDNKLITGQGEVEYVIDGRKFIVPAFGVVEKKNGVVQTRTATISEQDNFKMYFERLINELKFFQRIQKSQDKSKEISEFIIKINKNIEEINSFRQPDSLQHELLTAD